MHRKTAAGGNPDVHKLQKGCWIPKIGGSSLWSQCSEPWNRKDEAQSQPGWEHGQHCLESEILSQENKTGLKICRSIIQLVLSSHFWQSRKTTPCKRRPIAVLPTHGTKAKASNHSTGKRYICQAGDTHLHRRRAFEGTATERPRQWCSFSFPWLISHTPCGFYLWGQWTISPYSPAQSFTVHFSFGEMNV